MVTDHITKLLEDTDSLEPGDIKPGEYIQKPRAESTDSPATPGMVVADLTSAGYSYLYDTITREPSLVNNNMKLTQLRVLRENGTPVFTAVRPNRPPWKGTIKCFLHADQPERERYTQMGFPSCPKTNIPNKYQADNHARNRHRNEWKAVEAEREAQERAEDRRVQQAVLTSIAQSPASEGVAEAPVTTVATPSKPQTGGHTGQCVQCDWRSTASKSQSRKISLKRHFDKEHGSGAG